MSPVPVRSLWIFFGRNATKRNQKYKSKCQLEGLSALKLLILICRLKMVGNSLSVSSKNLHLLKGMLSSFLIEEKLKSTTIMHKLKFQAD